MKKILSSPWLPPAILLASGLVEGCLGNYWIALAEVMIAACLVGAQVWGGDDDDL